MRVLASRANVATLAVFASREGRENACWGASPAVGDTGRPKSRRACFFCFSQILLPIPPGIGILELTSQRAGTAPCSAPHLMPAAAGHFSGAAELIDQYFRAANRNHDAKNAKEHPQGGACLPRKTLCRRKGGEAMKKPSSARSAP